MNKVLEVDCTVERIAELDWQVIGPSPHLDDPRAQALRRRLHAFCKASTRLDPLYSPPVSPANILGALQAFSQYAQVVDHVNSLTHVQLACALGRQEGSRHGRTGGEALVQAMVWPLVPDDIKVASTISKQCRCEALARRLASWSISTYFRSPHQQAFLEAYYSNMVLYAGYHAFARMAHEIGGVPRATYDVMAADFARPNIPGHIPLPTQTELFRLGRSRPTDVNNNDLRNGFEERLQIARDIIMHDYMVIPWYRPFGCYIRRIRMDTKVALMATSPEAVIMQFISENFDDRYYVEYHNR